MKLIGVDIGGSHISVGQVGFDGQRAIVSGFAETEVDVFGTEDQILDSWATSITKSIDDPKGSKIGIAMPGPFDYSNGISLIKDQGKMNSLYGLSIKNLLATRLKINPVQIKFTNDAEAFLAGESYAGSGRSFENALGITLGTGLGSAIKMKHEIWDGKLWTASFRSGIAEDFLGTAWFVKYAKDKFETEISGVKELVQPDFDSAISDIIFKEFGLTLGEFLDPYLVKFQSKGVVLGGKVSLAADRFLCFTHDYLRAQGIELPIAVSFFGEKSALIGAVLPFLASRCV